MHFFKHSILIFTALLLNVQNCWSMGDEKHSSRFTPVKPKLGDSQCKREYNLCDIEQKMRYGSGGRPRSGCYKD